MGQKFERLKSLKSGVTVFRYKANDWVADTKAVAAELWCWFPINALYVFGLDRVYIKRFRRDLELDDHFGNYHYHRKGGGVVYPKDYSMLWEALKSAAKSIAPWFSRADNSSWPHRNILATNHKPKDRRD